MDASLYTIGTQGTPSTLSLSLSLYIYTYVCVCKYTYTYYVLPAIRMDASLYTIGTQGSVSTLFTHNAPLAHPIMDNLNKTTLTFERVQVRKSIYTYIYHIRMYICVCMYIYV